MIIKQLKYIKCIDITKKKRDITLNTNDSEIIRWSLNSCAIKA